MSVATDNLHTKITQLEATITAKDLEIEQLRALNAGLQASEPAVISATNRIDAAIQAVGTI